MGIAVPYKPRTALYREPAAPRHAYIAAGSPAFRKKAHRRPDEKVQSSQSCRASRKVDPHSSAFSLTP
jgi:hypothetical protein